MEKALTHIRRYAALLLIIPLPLLSACTALEKRSLHASKQTVPLIIAHRAGTEDEPENTLLAIREALKNGADLIWLTVQLSQEGVPVLYRPANLATWTETNGAVADKTLLELQQLNAGWNFVRVDARGHRTYPYRAQRVQIPTLREALRFIPLNVPIILDMKALPAQPQAEAVARVLEEENAWGRVMIYSTETAYQQAFATYRTARLFESRDHTRQRLVSVALEHQCPNPPPSHTWVGFEYTRPLSVIEKFTLGEGRSEVHASMWTPESIACFRRNPQVQIVAFGIHHASDYRKAGCLGIHAVLADSPRKMKIFKEKAGRSLNCP